MFGYFVRRVDKRFQLERGLGLLDQGDSDAVSRLERLFAQVNIVFCSIWRPLLVFQPVLSNASVRTHCQAESHGAAISQSSARLACQY